MAVNIYAVRILSLEATDPEMVGCLDKMHDAVSRIVNDGIDIEGKHYEHYATASMEAVPGWYRAEGLYRMNALVHVAQKMIVEDDGG